MQMPSLETFDEWRPEEIPQGYVCKAGTAHEYVTGGWRSKRPVWDADACTNCMMCWVVCPDSSIVTKDAKMVGIDYDHCKGCGVCVHECKFDALSIIKESEALAKEGK